MRTVNVESMYKRPDWVKTGSIGRATQNFWMKL